MSWFDRLFGAPGAPEVMAEPQWRLPMASGGVREFQVGNVNSAKELADALRTGMTGTAGQPVTIDTALRVATVMACVRIRSGAVANMPLGIKERVDERTRRNRTDLPVWRVLNRRPNKWQRPAEFKRMMEAHVQLRGNAYAVKVYGVGKQLLGLIPLHPDRVKVDQLADMQLAYTFTAKDGRTVVFPQEEIFHLRGLSLDGITGLSPLTYMREAISTALAMERHGATVFGQGANVSGAFKLPAGRTLTVEQSDALRAQLDQYRSGGSRDGKVIVLEDGLEFQQMALNAEDAQWLQGREFSRIDICMFYGVMPHLIGITSGNTQLGSSIETQGQGFLTYTLEDSLVAWEEAVGAECLDWSTNDLYARFNRNAIVRADLKTRWEGYVKGLQWGVYSPNQVLQMEDENPRDGGDVYYDPPNTAGTPGGNGNGGTSNVAA
jgi:HK97 family phage portal protein